MWLMIGSRVLTVLAAYTATIGCTAYARPVTGESSVQAVASAPVTPPNKAAIERARADSARYPYTAADIEFVSGMIAHHTQATVIAGWAESRGASGAVRILADRIIIGQQDEIVTMQTWLHDRRQPLADPARRVMKMTMNGVEHEMAMPGMLTDDQLRRLDRARGRTFDRLFLTFMIQHHQGAISMVSALLGTQGAMQDQTIFKLASDINADQSTEIARMQQMLKSLPLD